MRHRGPGPLGIALVIVTILAGGMTVGRAGATPGPAQSDRAGDVRLALIDQQFAFAPDGELRIRFRLDGQLPPSAPPPPAPTTEPPNGDEVAEPVPEDGLRIVVVNYQALESDDLPSRYVGPDAVTARRSRAIDGLVIAGARDLLTAGDDGTLTLDLTVGTDRGESVEDRLRFDEPGLYPVVVSLVDGDGEDGVVLASTGTIVQRLPDPADDGDRRPVIDLAIAAAIDEIGPMPTADEVTEARGRLDDTLALIAAVDSPATLSIPPIVLAAAAERDREALMQALADDRLLSVPAAPLDVSAAAAAGATDAFARQLREGEDLLTAAVPTNVARRDVWIATEPLSAFGAQVVRDLGFRYVVMTPAMFVETVAPELPRTDLFVAIALPDGGTLPLLVVDDLGTQLTTMATDRILADRSAIDWAVATTARLLLDQDGAPGDDDSGRVNRSRIVATPDLIAPDPRLIAALEQVVATTPSIRFTEAGNLPGVTDVARDGGDDVVVALPATVELDITDRIARLDTAAVAMLSAGSMLPADDPRPADWAGRIADLVSTGYTEAEVDASLDELLAEAERLKSSVVPPEPFAFTLTGRSGDIDLRLSNTADEPLTVLVRLSSPKLSFPEGERLIELPPNEQTLVAVPVRARTNGTSSVRVELLTPAGETIHEPVVLTSRVNALTGFVQVLTGGLILVLATWWFSHWRARRREAAVPRTVDVEHGHPTVGK